MAPREDSIFHPGLEIRRHSRTCQHIRQFPHATILFNIRHQYLEAYMVTLNEEHRHQIPHSFAPNAIGSPQRRLHELDGWRAISVLLVIFHHMFSVQYPELIRPFYLLWHVSGLAGFLGVDTFFVISGFVICRLLVSEESQYGSISLKGFYYRRVFRILPPLFLYLAFIGMLIATGLVQDRWRYLAFAALFLNDLNIFPTSWLLSHTWSLAIEEQFYLFFPTIWVLTRRRWRGLVFACVFLLCVTWSLSLAIANRTILPDGDAIRTRVGFACISYGVLMAIHEQRVRHFAARLPGWIVALLALVLLIHPMPHGAVKDVLYSALFMPPAIGLVLIYSLECGGWLRGFLCSRPMQAIGLTSYGIYLWQQLFTGPVSLYSAAGLTPHFFLPLLFLVVPLSYLFVEKQAMRFGKELSRRARSSMQERSV
jgi:peptidoglycan/LPS O-acetylase OafA/YrhL